MSNRRRRLCAVCEAVVPVWRHNDGKPRTQAERHCHFLIDRKVKCTRVVTTPVTDGLCIDHHPLYRGSNVEKVALEAAAKGGDPVKALRAAGHSQKAAVEKVRELADQPSYHGKLTRLMQACGLDEADGLRALKRALEAKRALVSRSGDVVGEEDDAKVQLEAAELMLRMQGLDPRGAPAQGGPTGSGPPGFNISVGVVIPGPKPLSPSMPVIEAKRSDD